MTLRATLRAATFVLCSAHAHGVMCAEAMLTFRQQPTLNSPDFRLGDIAVIAADDAALEKAAAAVVIGSLPRAGAEIWVNRERVERVLIRAIPRLRGNLHWQGEQGVKLVVEARVADDNETVELAKRYLESRIGAEFERVEIKFQGFDHAPVLPQGAVSFTVRGVNPARIARRMCVWIEASVNGRFYQSIPHWFSVQAYRGVLIAKLPMARGRTVTADDFQHKITDVAALNTEALTELPATAKRLTHSIGAGQVLGNGDIESAPAISRNQEVVVRVRSGTVALEASGVATADAHVGDRIKIKNARSGEFYTAIVVDAGIVSVNLQ